MIFNYIRALLTQVPMLAQQIEKETAESFDLAGDVSIEIMTASFKSIRGRTVVACLADEIAFWPTDDAADPDYAGEQQKKASDTHSAVSRVSRASCWKSSLQASAAVSDSAK